MAREDLHFRLRIPEALKGRIEAAAATTRRSMTAEIIARLEESFGREEEGVRPVWLTPEIWQRIEHEANVQEMDPNLIILGALEEAFPPIAGVADRLRAVSQDIIRRGIEHTPEGREILETVEKLIAKQDQPRRPWKKD